MARKLTYNELAQVVRMLEKDLREYQIAKTAAVKAHEELERVLNAVPDYLAVIDHQYKIQRVNLSLAKKLKCAPEELIGKSCFRYICQAEHPPSSCPHAKMLGDGKINISENYNKQSGMNMLVTSSPLHDDKGSLIGGVHTARAV
jgi:PAS domain-containing protein